MIRISWYSTVTGYKGHGDWFPKKHVEALNWAVSHGNNQWPMIRHKIEHRPTGLKLFLLNIVYTILYQFDQHKNEVPNWWYK